MVSLPEEVPGNGSLSIRGEQSSSLASSSNPCTATVREVKLSPSVGSSAQRETFWLVDRLTYRDCFHQHLLKGEPHAVEAIFFFLFMLWSLGLLAVVWPWLWKRSSDQSSQWCLLQTVCHIQRKPPRVLLQFTKTVCDDLFSKSPWRRHNFICFDFHP